MINALRFGLTSVLLGALAGCPQPSGEGSGAAAGASATSAAALPGASAASAAAAASAAPANPDAGVWKGQIQVVKGEVTVDEGVPYAVWKDEPGKAMTGPARDRARGVGQRGGQRSQQRSVG